jgi:fructokinase
LKLAPYAGKSMKTGKTNMPPCVLVPGTVLLDIYAESGQRFLGGAEFNFAYHVHQLLGGLDFVARVGDDDNGRFILAELERRGFPVSLIQQDAHKPTKTVVVKKDAENKPTYCIPDDVAAEYLDFPPIAPAAYDLVYFGTTLQHGAQSRATLRRILAQSRGIKFCDLNLRPPKYTPEVVAYSLQICDFLKLNHEELEVISGIFDLSGSREERVTLLAQRFDLEGICLTLAEQGSVFWQDGKFYEKKLPAGTVVDTVGAGDAFSAVLAMGLLKAWEPVKMLDRASELAAAVCQIRGAVPEDKGFYSRFLWP